MSKLTEADVQALAEAFWVVGGADSLRDRLRMAARFAGLYAEPEPTPAPVTWREMCGRCRWWATPAPYANARECIEHSSNSSWVYTERWDWCSRYEARS